MNMPYMVVTLEVSKLSGWLNTDAYCRELKGGHAMRGEVWAGMTERCGQALCTGPYCVGTVDTVGADVIAPGTCLPCP